MTDQESAAEMLANQVRLEEQLRGLTALTEAGQSRQADEIKALFETTRTTAQRVEKIAETSVQLLANSQRAAEEIRALFAKSRENATRISAIQVDYVPKSECGARELVNRQEHTETTKQVDNLKWRVALISGGISLAAFLAGLIVRGIGVLGK